MAPYDWIDPHQGNAPQINREDAGLSDAEKAIAEDRSRALRVPGIKPGKLMDEPDAKRGVDASDPRGLVFDDDTGVLRPYSDEDFGGKPKRAAKSDDKPATEKQQEAMERNAPRHVAVERK
jgi:hypothetical protein